MPRDVNVVPFHDPDSRHQGDHGTDEGHGRCVNPVQAVSTPKDKDTHKYSNGLPFLDGHPAHRVQFGFQTLQTAVNLRLLLVLLHREEHIHPHQKTDDQNQETHRAAGHQPVRVTELARPGGTEDQGDGQQVGAASCVEGIGPDVDLKQVLDHEVASEIVAVTIRRSVDGADNHKDRKHYRGLDGRGGDKHR